MSANQTEATPPKKTSQESGWAAWRARNEWFDLDLFGGALMGSLVLACAVAVPDILADARAALFAVLGAALALAGIVFAGLSLLVALLTEDYLSVLKRAPGGIDSVWRPYMIVVWISLAASLVAVVAAALWSGFGIVGQAASLSVAVGLLVWAIIGAGQLVSITKFHGEMRMQLLGARHHARSLLEQRKSERDRSA